MKIVIAIGYLLLVLELGMVLMMFLSRDMGDDAAGRGMARGFAMVLGPLVLIAGAAFVWGARGGPRPALWAGLLLVYVPVIFGAISFARGTFNKLDRTLGKAQHGRFADKSMTALARAISDVDTAKVAALLAAGRPDWDARDEIGRTLLGHAIDEAIGSGNDPNQVAIVRQLIDAGAPVRDTELAAERSMASVSEHNLVYHLYGVPNPHSLAILDLVLSRGLSPNQVDEDSIPIYFSTYTTLAALEVLGKHGADFTRLDPRQDRLHQNALMAWINLREWDISTFLLERGVSPDYTAPDGRSARSILAEVDPPGEQYTEADSAARARFLAALQRVSKPTR